MQGCWFMGCQQAWGDWISFGNSDVYVWRRHCQWPLQPPAVSLCLSAHAPTWLHRQPGALASTVQPVPAVVALAEAQLAVTVAAAASCRRHMAHMHVSVSVAVRHTPRRYIRAALVGQPPFTSAPRVRPVSVHTPSHTTFCLASTKVTAGSWQGQSSVRTYIQAHMLPSSRRSHAHLHWLMQTCSVVMLQKGPHMLSSMQGHRDPDGGASASHQPCGPKISSYPFLPNGIGVPVASCRTTHAACHALAVLFQKRRHASLLPH